MPEEVDRERWRVGLAQFDCARELLSMVGVSAHSDEFDVNLEMTTPRSARMVLDALRAVYESEVQRLSDAATDQVHLPLREIPTLRNFIVDVEGKLERAAKRLQPLVDASEKRAPRTVKTTP